MNGDLFCVVLLLLTLQHSKTTLQHSKIGQLYNTTVSTRKVHFSPGTTTTFDFFNILPELKSNPLHKQYCVQGKCNFTIYKAFSDKANQGSTRFDTKFVTDEGPYILSVKSGEIGFIFPYILEITASYMYMVPYEDYLYKALPKVRRGRTVVVPCPVLGDPQPSATWSKRHGDQLLEIVSDGDKYTITKLGHLFISNFSDADVGKYFCSARNACGGRSPDQSICRGKPVQSGDYYMNMTNESATVSDKPKYFFLNPKSTKCWLDKCYWPGGYYSTLNMYISLYSDVNVEVFVNMHSNSSYAGAKIFTDYNSPRFSLASDKICNGVLRNYTYKDVELNSVDCAAYYTNGMMSDPIAKYSLTIVEPPHIYTTTNKMVIKYGSNYKTQFLVAKGHEDALNLPLNVTKIVCFKNGESFKMQDGWHKECLWDNSTGAVFLSIKCATVTDTGYYQIGATNRFGSRMSSPVYILVNDDEPRKRDCYPLTSTVLSATTVLLEWSTPPTDDSTLIYEIRVDNVLWATQAEEKQVKETDCQIQGLSPGTFYNAMVTANGELVGQRIQFRTHQTAPSAAPLDVSCVPVYSRLQCSWEKIPIENRNGDITFYKVKYRWYYSWEVNDTAVEYITSESLKPYTTYTIQVMGCTIAGCGPSGETTQTTAEDLPKFPPVLRYILPGKNNIRIGWDRPFGSFKQINYTVKCKEALSSSLMFIKNVTTVDAVIAGQNIQGETKYILTVTPHTTQGHGPALTQEVETLSRARGLTLSTVLYLVCVLYFAL